MPQRKYRNSRLHADRTLASCKQYEPIKTAIVHPVKSTAIEAAKEAFDEELIEPILVGNKELIHKAADEAEVDIKGWTLLHAETAMDAGALAAAKAGEKKVDALMKGSLHSDQILRAVLGERRLKTDRRLSHVYAMDVRTYHKPLLITDAAINIAPDLPAKIDIVQNAIYLWHAMSHDQEMPKVALLSAVEKVKPRMQSTIDAACLCKMADRNQITGGLLDGPLAFDNAISKEAAVHKGIISEVAGDPDILMVPDIEAGNILAKQLTFLAEAEAAGIVLGAKCPVILTSRSDSVRTRLLSCAIAVKMAVARKEGRTI